MVKGSDVLFFCREYARAVKVESAPALLYKLRSQQRFRPGALVVCTWGERGAYALRNDSPESPVIHCEAVKVAVRDSVGAGDTFLAGFLFALLQRASVARCLQYACTLAARKLAQYGFHGLNLSLSELPPPTATLEYPS